MTTFLQDLRYALRTFRKSPGFAFIAVATLALGIGANAAIFALVDRVLLTLLPVRNPKELVLLRSPGPAQGHTWSDGDDAASFSYPMYRDLRDQNTVFTGLLAEYPFDATVSARGESERASGELVSGNYFEVLGVPPALGRNLTAEDDRAPGAHPETVLSHGYWTRRFGNDPSVLNKTIVVNGLPLTVVGVAPAGFSGIQPGRPADLFVPMMMKAQMTPFWNGLDDPKDHWLQMVGTLEARSLARAGAGGAPGHVPASARGAPSPDDQLERQHAPAIPGQEDPPRRRGARPRGVAPGRRKAARLPHGDGRPRAADRVLEPGRAARGARRGPPAGVRDPPGDRREPQAAAAAVDRRVPPLHVRRRRAGASSSRPGRCTRCSGPSRRTRSCARSPRRSIPGSSDSRHWSRSRRASSSASRRPCGRRASIRRGRCAARGAGPCRPPATS